MGSIRGNVLRPGAAEPTPGVVEWDGDRIARVADPGDAPADVVDVGDALVLPGIVDVHGDAFERAVMPRGGVAIDLDLALAANDVQLLAAGVTTAYLSITDSWEPGLRSRAMLADLLDACGRRPRRAPRLEIHVRHERANTADLEQLAGWIEDGSVRMLSYNDHTGHRVSAAQIDRSGVGADGLQSLLEAAMAELPVGEAQETRLAEVAAAAACVTASHDADSEDDLVRDVRLGVAMAEFPTTIELARRYREQGIAVLLGAPNLVRGTSHLGNLSVRDAWAAGAGDLLCSDYHYPSLLAAPFCLVGCGLASFGSAWDAVSAVPARVAGLTDRGELRAGALADLLVVEPASSDPVRSPAVKRAIVGGELAFVGP